MAAAGCSKASDDAPAGDAGADAGAAYLATEDLVLVADVTAASETSADVAISFLAGSEDSNTAVDLGDDALAVDADGTSKVPSSTTPGEYSATFATGTSEATFSIALDRSSAGLMDAPETPGSRRAGR